MSVYDIIEKISNVTKVYYRKKYNPYYIVAKFYIKDKHGNVLEKSNRPLLAGALEIPCHWRSLNIQHLI